MNRDPPTEERPRPATVSLDDRCRRPKFSAHYGHPAGSGSEVEDFHRLKHLGQAGQAVAVIRNHLTTDIRVKFRLGRRDGADERFDRDAQSRSGVKESSLEKFSSC